ncbi:lysylphosphatidylglycerol synthase transmembrane domain-containing protein [Mucilaginibacter paludis]|uniref:Heat shock protein DnaJ domain protein n=1 Tax=Mucilaginibacter paludis DSM 18603 TaxID=714943 RepID=H1Y6X8_9SPHI|nr:lysylphosphatidylglycerol synthase transmembrane domain-containing protein [Mucilaginibacter paludis]EHQ28385.1 heat shock protein DnaJ domain protein [Mucilaginibacter paludis DSM 18603]
MAEKDYYDILGINSDATSEDVNEAYRKINKPNPDAEEAYQILSDTDKRRMYDETYIGPFDPSDSYLVEDLETITAEKKPKTFKDRLWSATKLLLKIAVTGLLLYYVFSKIHFDQVKSLVSEANPLWALAAILTFFVSTMVSASRLMSFFKSIDLHIRWQFNLRLYMLGMFYNLFLPGGIGGDGYKIYLLNKNYKMPAKKVFWAILFDRLSGFWAIGLITAVLVIFLPQLKVLHITPLLAWTVFLGATAVYLFVAYKFFKDYTKHFVEAHIKAVGVQSLQVLTILLVMIALHHTEKYAPYLSAFLMSSMAAVIPFSVGGLGFREFIFKYVVAEMFHMNGDLAVVLSLSFYVISGIISLLGVYYVFRTDRLEKDLPVAEKKK